MSNDDPRTKRIVSRVRHIPKGRVQTYGDIDPQAPRIVGRVLHNVHDAVPWYRVVRADGSLPMGDRQRELLLAEGVPMKGDRVDLRIARGGVPDLADRERSAGTANRTRTQVRHSTSRRTPGR